MSLSVCVCLSVCDNIFDSRRLIFNNFFVHVTHGCGSVVLWQCSDTLCTSGFMDDVIFAHKPRLLDVAAQLKQCTHCLGLGYKLCAIIPIAGQWMLGTTFCAESNFPGGNTPGRSLRSLTAFLRVWTCLYSVGLILEHWRETEQMPLPSDSYRS